MQITKFNIQFNYYFMNEHNHVKAKSFTVILIPLEISKILY